MIERASRPADQDVQLTCLNLSPCVIGFYDVLFKGNPFKFTREYGSYVMENVLFKLKPAEFHSQTFRIMNWKHLKPGEAC